MITQSGCNIVHAARLPWEERVRFDGKKIRSKTFWHDTEHNLCMQLIDQPANLIEPCRVDHTHNGTHAAVVLKGRAQADGLTLNTLDVILGAGEAPQDALIYPDSTGCQLFNCFQGNNEHAEKRHRLIQSAQTPWDAKAGGALHMKPLVSEGAGRLMLTAMRLSAGFTVPVGSRPHLQAALVVEGSAVVGDETLRAWDFMYMAAGVPHGPISFPDGATLLMVAMRAA